jgi:lipid-A-disaccharide synthase
VRQHLPHLPIIDYVSPSVWAWRPGRARKMRAYIDHVLAVLPFEPEAHRRLSGPPCTYVGHPLIEKMHLMTPSAGEQARRQSSPPVVLVLPGSRRSEITRLMADFGAAIDLLAQTHGPLDVRLPLHKRSNPGASSPKLF